jgi:hypothetical protein
MPEIPEKNLEENNMAVVSAQEATAAILPWLAKPQKLRFSPDLNTRWTSACQRLHGAWADRHGAVANDIRPAVFALYSLTLETGDLDCLRLGEALASAIDYLEEESIPPRIVAALSACIECLVENGGLEHPAFSERMQHFSGRLEKCVANAKETSERSAVIDRLFVAETHERLERMHDALAALPPDGETLLVETDELLEDAEHLALYGLVHVARQLQRSLQQASVHNSLTSETIRAHVLSQLKALEELIVTVDT